MKTFLCVLRFKIFYASSPPKSPRMFLTNISIQPSPMKTLTPHLWCSNKRRLFVLVIEHLHVSLNLGSKVFLCILVQDLQTPPPIHSHCIEPSTDTGRWGAISCNLGFTLMYIQFNLFCYRKVICCCSKILPTHMMPMLLNS